MFAVLIIGISNVWKLRVGKLGNALINMEILLKTFSLHIPAFNAAIYKQK